MVLWWLGVRLPRHSPGLPTKGGGCMRWRGTLRSLSGTLRSMDRAAMAGARAGEREAKRRARQTELEQAGADVQLYETYVKALVSIHKDCSPPRDWHAIRTAPQPTEPTRSDQGERLARVELHRYRPTLADKLLGRVEARRGELTAAVERAKAEDERRYQEVLQEYQELLGERERLRGLADGILARDPEAYGQAIGELHPLSGIAGLGTSIEFNTSDGSFIEATLHVNPEDIVPREVTALLASGKVSVRQMPKTRFHELYQDHVCSCVLRVARELFAFLPVDTVLVHASAELVNTTTGHLQPQTIVSTAIPRSTLKQLSFQALDCSDCLRNFVHRMKFSSRSGFSPVEALKPEDFAPEAEQAGNT